MNTNSNLFSLPNIVVFALCELIAIPLCSAAAAAVTAGQLLAGFAGWGIGIFLGLLGFTFHWWRGPIKNAAQDWFKRSAPVAIPIALLVFFIYVFGSALWGRFEHINSPKGDIEVLNKKVAEIRGDLNCWAKPRRLSEKQISSVAKYLAAHPPQSIEFAILQYDEEAGNFRADIDRALRQGGWKITGYSYPAALQAGLGTDFFQTAEHRTQEEDPKKPNAPMILQEAFALAHIQIDHSGSTSAPLPAAEDRLVIEIGRRFTNGYGQYCPQTISKDIVVPPFDPQ